MSWHGFHPGNIKYLYVGNNVIASCVGFSAGRIKQIKLDDNLIQLSTIEEMQIASNFARLYHGLVLRFLRKFYKFVSKAKSSYTWEIPYHPLCAKYKRISDQWSDIPIRGLYNTHYP